MKLSLKQQLVKAIHLKGYLSYSEAEAMCNGRRFGRTYKIDTARRRLDEEMKVNTNIVADGLDERGYVKGWRWVGEPQKWREVKVLGMNGNCEKIIKLPVT